MKSRLSIVASALAAVSLFTGCEITYRPVQNPPPVFDPTGTWQAGNGIDATLSADYLPGSRSAAYSCPTEACTSSAEFNAQQTQGAALYNFDSNDDTPAVLESASHVTVLSYGDGFVYINVNGTGFNRGSDPRTNPDFQRMPATHGYSTVQTYPAPGQAVQANYLGSLGCAYLYTVSLSLSFSGSNAIQGYVTSRFTFRNTDLADLRDNPSCDAIFATYQADFATRTETLEDEGVFFVMANMAVNADGSRALDRSFVADVDAIQFDHYFEAARSSTIPSDQAPGRALAQINRDFIKSKIVAPAALFRNMRLDLNKIRRTTVRPRGNRPVVHAQR